MPTLVLFGAWPRTYGYNPAHPLFQTHRLVSDAFVSDLCPSQSLRDVLADGALLRRREWRVLTMRKDGAIAGSELAREHCACDTEAELIANVAKGEGLQLVILPNGPLAALDEQAVKSNALAAIAHVRQTLALTTALDLACQLRDAANGAFVALAYGAQRMTEGVWQPSAATVAVLPHDFEVPIPVALPVVATLALAHAGVHVDDPDLHHDEGATVTIDQRDEFWWCVCHVGVDRARYEVRRRFPANQLHVLPRAFLDVGDGGDWIVREHADESDNLALDPAWRRENGRRVLGACMGAVRDIVRRRTETLLPDLETYLYAARPLTSPRHDDADKDEKYERSASNASHSTDVDDLRSSPLIETKVSIDDRGEYRVAVCATADFEVKEGIEEEGTEREEEERGEEEGARKERAKEERDEEDGEGAKEERGEEREEEEQGEEERGEEERGQEWGGEEERGAERKGPGEGEDERLAETRLGVEDSVGTEDVERGVAERGNGDDARFGDNWRDQVVEAVRVAYGTREAELIANDLKSVEDRIPYTLIVDAQSSRVQRLEGSLLPPVLDALIRHGVVHLPSGDAKRLLSLAPDGKHVRVAGWRVDRKSLLTAARIVVYRVREPETTKPTIPIVRGSVHRFAKQVHQNRMLAYR